MFPGLFRDSIPVGLFGSFCQSEQHPCATELCLDSVETGTGVFVSGGDTGTDPLDPDSDGDGLLDGVETGTGLFVSGGNTGTDPNDVDSDILRWSLTASTISTSIPVPTT